MFEVPRPVAVPSGGNEGYKDGKNAKEISHPAAVPSRGDEGYKDGKNAKEMPQDDKLGKF